MPRRSRRCRGGVPAIVVNAAVRKHLEVLRVALGRCIGVRLVERVRHAHALDGLLRDPVDRLGRAKASRFQNRRHDIDHMVELRADTAGIIDVTWPEIAMPCRVPPKCEATCFTHLKGVSNAHDHGTAMCG